MKYKCGPCKQAFKSNENAIACDTCDEWFHPGCIGMNDTTFHNHTKDNSLPWNCIDCGDLADDNTDYESDSEDINRCQTNNVPRKVSKLRILVCNFQSIWNKRNSLEIFVETHKIDIVVGSETHLNNSIKNSEFLPPGFLAKRKDRDDGYGGVIIMYRDKIKANEITHDTAEIVSLKIETYQKPVIISACYRSMNNSNEKNKQLSAEITRLGSKYKNSHIWIGGDFNLPDIDWSNNTISSHQYPKELNEQYLESFELSNLKQLVDFPTLLQKSYSRSHVN